MTVLDVQRYGLKRLVYYERFKDIRDAIQREKTIKDRLHSNKCAIDLTPYMRRCGIKKLNVQRIAPFKTVSGHSTSSIDDRLVQRSVGIAVDTDKQLFHLARLRLQAA